MSTGIIFAALVLVAASAIAYADNTPAGNSFWRDGRSVNITLLASGSDPTVL